MPLLKEFKEEIVNTYQLHGNDTGSCEVQVALLTECIAHLTQEHFRLHVKDKHSLRGLRQKVSTRKRLLKYLKKQSPTRYEKLIQQLGLRG